MMTVVNAEAVSTSKVIQLKKEGSTTVVSIVLSLLEWHRIVEHCKKLIAPKKAGGPFIHPQHFRPIAHNRVVSDLDSPKNLTCIHVLFSGGLSEAHIFPHELWLNLHLPREIDPEDGQEVHVGNLRFADRDREYNFSLADALGI